MGQALVGALVGAMLAWRTERSEAVKIKVCSAFFLKPVEF
jgi:hypothetical protein